MFQSHVFNGKMPPTANPNVTVGFKWSPEMLAATNTPSLFKTNTTNHVIIPSFFPLPTSLSFFNTSQIMPSQIILHSPFFMDRNM